MTDMSRRTRKEHDPAPQEWEEPVFEEAEDSGTADPGTADETADGETEDHETADGEPIFDEPVFDESQPAQTDPFVDQQLFVPLPEDAATGAVAEPVFDVARAEDAGEATPVATGTNATDSTSGGATTYTPKSRWAAVQRPVDPGNAEEVRWDDADTTPVARPRGRRLGRTGPFWLMGAGALAVILLVVWLAFFRDSEETGAPPELTPIAEGVSGSTMLPVETEPADPTPEQRPTPTSVPLLSVGQQVIVGNTSGQGIRLRNEPGLNGLTLAIYKDGDSFTVLNPDGDDTEYPVEMDGYRWYRIQVTGNPDENLTGWAAGDFLIPAGE